MDDMNFLAKHVYPRIVSDHIAHDSMHCANWLHSTPFPVMRNPEREHVGQRFFGDNTPFAVDLQFSFKSPPKCELDTVARPVSRM